MTYASSVLTKELQQAVKNRTKQQPASSSTTQTRSLDYKVSDQARDYLERLRTYREQAKTVRVGRY